MTFDPVRGHQGQTNIKSIEPFQKFIRRIQDEIKANAITSSTATTTIESTVTETVSVDTGEDIVDLSGGTEDDAYDEDTGGDDTEVGDGEVGDETEGDDAEGGDAG